MSSLRVILRCKQHEEPWANGAGSTTVLLREPDCAEWTVRVSVARVDHPGPFSEFPQTRRMLVPLDAPMVLRFADGHEQRAARFGTLCFDGAPAPFGLLPEGPTRDFNLMLRGGMHGDVLPRALAGSMVLPRTRGLRWLLYLDSGSARINADAATPALNPRDAALISAEASSGPIQIEGAGEIVLVKLYA